MDKIGADIKCFGRISEIDGKSGDENVTLTICFCDDNCRPECQHDLPDSDKCKEEKAKISESIKKKLSNCKQVKIANKNDNNISNFNKIICRYQPDDVSPFKNEYLGANGLQSVQRNELVPKCNTLTSNKILNSISRPDVIIVVNSTEFKCSVELLKRYSKIFRNLEIQENCVVYICGVCVSEETFSVIYTWMQMYFAEPWKIINENNIVDVLTACVCLEVSDLERKCWEMVCSENLYSGEKSFKIYMRSSEKEINSITSAVFDRVIKYFPVLLNTSVFLELKSKQLIPILNSDDLKSNSEMEIFLATCKWIIHDTESRIQCLPDIIKCVRFGLMTPEQLCSLHLLDVPENIRIIVSHPFTARKIEDGLVLNSLKNEFNYPEENSWEFWYKCKELGIDVFKERSKNINLQTCLCHKNECN